MTADHKKPGVAFWATVVFVAVLAYPASFGPACWWLSKPAMLVDEFRLGDPVDCSEDNDSDLDLQTHVPHIYWPMGWLALRGPQPIGHMMKWYATIGNPLYYLWVPADPDGDIWLRF